MLLKRMYSPLLLLFYVFCAVHPTFGYDSNNNVRLTEDRSSNQQDRSIRSRRDLPIEKARVTGKTCYGYQNTKGRCVPLQICVLKSLQENYIKYKDYFCIIEERQVGVCCPNSIAFPNMFEENKQPTLHQYYNQHDTSTTTTLHQNYTDITTNITPTLHQPYNQHYNVQPIFKNLTSSSINDKIQPVFLSNNAIEKWFRHRTLRESSFPDIPMSILIEENTCGRSGEQLLDNFKTVFYPWVASLKIASSLTHFCGGTLISRYHVISAAHCFVFKEGKIAKTENVIVRLGEYDFNDNKTIYNDHKVADIIYHENYDVVTYENDIAVLVLETPARYSAYIQPICLPRIEKYDNRKGIVVGWGFTKSGGPGSEILLEIEVPVWTLAECQNSMVQTIFNTNICAGDKDGKKDSCQNDSGGPLMMRRKIGLNMRWELVGIVSWGVKCATKGRPGVYTQVNKYLDWIYKQLNDS